MAGFQALRATGPGNDCGQVESYNVASSAGRLAIGDVVDSDGTGSATGLAGCDVAGTTGQILGVIMGFEVDPSRLTETGLPASTQGVARVNTNPFQVYRVDVSNGPLASTQIGLNVDNVISVSTLSGGMSVSNHTVNATGVNTTNTFPWNVVGLEEDSAGVYGNVALVRPNTTLVSAPVTGA